jgi:hypothetical protein
VAIVGAGWKVTPSHSLNRQSADFDEVRFTEAGNSQPAGNLAVSLYDAPWLSVTEAPN